MEPEKYSEIFSKYYDQLMCREARKNYERITYFIDKYKGGDIDNLLELGCGTGEVIKYFENDFDITGIDISPWMIKEAKKKLSYGNVYEMDMKNFKFNQNFDLIFSVFDSINHLLKKEEWEKTFRNVSKHLNNRGLFIFDINTPYKFEKTASLASNTYQVDEFTSILFHEYYMGNNRFRFNINIFSLDQSTGNLERFEQDIYEISFHEEEVKKMLNNYFEILEIIHTSRRYDNNKPLRTYFICRLKE